jgi:hypothetical protein
MVHHISHVDHIGSGDDGNLDPCLCGWVPHLQTLGIVFREEDGDATIVGVVTHYKEPRVSEAHVDAQMVKWIHSR